MAQDTDVTVAVMPVNLVYDVSVETGGWEDGWGGWLGRTAGEDREEIPR